MYASQEEARKALSLNQSEFMGKHLRVDSLVRAPTDGPNGEGKRQQSRDDFTTTVFVGNLPYIVSEEEVRGAFAKFGQILNVRLVRDPKTFIGKGIGYVQFAEQAMMRAAVEAEVQFKGRELRLKRATDPKKREKKATRKQKALEERRAARAAKRAAESDSDGGNELPRNFEDAYSSDDSDDAKVPKHVVSLEGAQFAALARERRAGEDSKELKLQNSIAFNQRKKQAMLREMIASAGRGGKVARLEETKLQKRTFKEKYEKPVERFKVTKKRQVEKRREENLKKLNKIKIKTKKI